MIAYDQLQPSPHPRKSKRSRRPEALARREQIKKRMIEKALHKIRQSRDSRYQRLLNDFIMGYIDDHAPLSPCEIRIVCGKRCRICEGNVLVHQIESVKHVSKLHTYPCLAVCENCVPLADLVAFMNFAQPDKQLMESRRRNYVELTVYTLYFYIDHSSPLSLTLRPCHVCSGPISLCASGLLTTNKYRMYPVCYTCLRESYLSSHLTRICDIMSLPILPEIKRVILRVFMSLPDRRAYWNLPVVL